MVVDYGCIILEVIVTEYTNSLTYGRIFATCDVILYW